MPKFEKTARHNFDVDEALLAAVVATEGQKDEAIKLHFGPDENMEDFRSNLRAALRRLDLKLRYKFNKPDQALIVYAERYASDSDPEEDAADKASLTA